MTAQQEILNRIPHRPPFLWVDEIIAVDSDRITTRKTIPTDLDIFSGHYPGNPLMPGVLLCEAVFQSGALLMSHRQEDSTGSDRVPVLTRIEGARFKRMVGPGDTIEITVSHKETVTNVSFMKGTVKVGGKVAVQVDFACALAGKAPSA